MEIRVITGTVFHNFGHPPKCFERPKLIENSVDRVEIGDFDGRNLVISHPLLSHLPHCQNQPLALSLLISLSLPAHKLSLSLCACEPKKRQIKEKKQKKEKKKQRKEKMVGNPLGCRIDLPNSLGMMRM